MKKLFFITAFFLFIFVLVCVFGQTEKSVATESAVSASSEQLQASELSLTSEATQEPTSEPTPEPTLEPTPEPVEILGQSIRADSTSLDLTKMEDSDLAEVIAALPKLQNLEQIKLSSQASVENFITIAQSAPNAEIEYSFELFGQEIDVQKTERLEYKKVEIGDEGLEQFRAVLPYLPNLKYLSFDRCGTTDEACAQLRDDFADTEIVWRIYFGSDFTCMTDAETIWASCDVRDETCDALKYCTKLKNLDIGHNDMTRLDFLQYMPDLEVLIISCSEFEDISDIVYCKNLVYFECSECHIRDLSPIAELENLEHLNCGSNPKVSDLSPLLKLKHLKRLFCNNMYNPALNMTEEQARFQEAMPDTEVDMGWYGDGTLNRRWRYETGTQFEHDAYVEEYKYIRDVFGYDLLEDSPYRMRKYRLD